MKKTLVILTTFVLLTLVSFTFISAALPPVTVYKTRANYNNLVPIGLSTDKSMITSYPAAGRVTYDGQLAYPGKLNQGYLLDFRGVGPNSAFLNITYEEYSQLEKTPSLTELFNSILDNDPFLEMYDCADTHIYLSQDAIEDLNEIINNGELDEKCIVIVKKTNDVACTQDAKLCPDGSYVSRNSSNNCEFNACPENDEEDEMPRVDYNISRERVCCKIYGYGTNMEEVNVNYIITTKRECSKPRNFVGGNREIVDNSYCIEQIKEKRDEFLEKKWEIMQERNRIKAQYRNQSECPDSCSCSGSTVKCSFENGTRVMTVYAGNSGNVIVQVKNINASTNVTLYKSDGKVYGVFKGNKTHEIILPDELKEKLQNHTRTRLYNESINLTEDGYYHIQAHKRARLFWIVPVREHVRAEVNAETGETIKIRNPWWGFLARDVRERNNSED